MKRPTWRVREDADTISKDGLRKVRANTGDPYTVEMSDKDWKLYQFATYISVIIVAGIILTIGVLIFA